MYKKLKLDTFTGNEATAHGERYEDEAIELFEKRTGCLVSSFGLLKIGEAHGKKIGFSMLAGSPDGILACGRAAIEVKCPFRRKIKRGVVPKYYMPQVQTILEILRPYNVNQAYFIQYDPRPDPYIYDVTRIGLNPLFLAQNLEKIKQFYQRWQDVKSGRAAVPPKSAAGPKSWHSRSKKRIRAQNEFVHTGGFDFCV